MKMKQLITLLILISSFAQAQFYEIDYEVRPQIKITAKALESLNNHYKDKKEREKELESLNKIDTLFYTFTYNTDVSRTSVVEKIDNSDDYNFDRVQIPPKIKGNSIVNYREKLFYYEQAFHAKTLLVYDSINNVNFTDTGKTKTILGIETKEAIGKYKDIEIIAWYAPSIPYEYSPDLFYGTKGLILELHYKYIDKESDVEIMISWIATKKKELREAPVIKLNNKLKKVSKAVMTEMQNKSIQQYWEEQNQGVDKKD
jgi:GLPGLI family protein